MRDLAWAEIAEDGQHSSSLQVQLAPVSSTVPSTMFFRQPYDFNAKRDGSESVVGAMSAILYPSMKSPLLEVLDIGFRGMSGALAPLSCRSGARHLERVSNFRRVASG